MKKRTSSTPPSSCRPPTKTTTTVLHGTSTSSSSSSVTLWVFLVLLVVPVFVVVIVSELHLSSLTMTMTAFESKQRGRGDDQVYNHQVTGIGIHHLFRQHPQDEEHHHHHRYDSNNNHLPLLQVPGSVSFRRGTGAAVVPKRNTATHPLLLHSHKYPRLTANAAPAAVSAALLPRGSVNVSADDASEGPYKLPPLDTFMDPDGRLREGRVPPDLLHYAIAGFGKCGTTTLSTWLRNHTSEIQALKSEVWALVQRDAGRLVRRLHRKLPSPQLMRGYKCPGDILSDTALTAYGQYFPRAKLIVGVRHPILWFQSLYNFRVQNYETFHMHPNELMGARCGDSNKNSKLTCTRRGFFAYYLMRLGKHEYSYDGVDVDGDGADRKVKRKRRKFTPLERNISKYYGWENELDRWYDFLDFKQDVFLYDVHQLADPDVARQAQLRRDLGGFLGLKQPLEPNPTRITPGKVANSTSVQLEKDSRKIDLCDDEYRPVRAELMDLARMSSEWIRAEFLGRPGVFVSSRAYLEELLESWMHDPCGTTNNNSTAAVSRSAGNRSRPRLWNTTMSLSFGDSSNNSRNSTDASTSTDRRPPLDSIIDDRGNIVGDPQPLLDFAIIGFGKCGTSTLLQWLADHPDTQCLREEIWALMGRDPARLIRTLYNDLPADPADRKYQRCNKCPLDITQWHILDYYRTLFPRTRLLVGVRHPVIWFQSLYNFRVQTRDDYEEMIHPNLMIGICYKKNKMICTRKGNFANFLIRLGKHYHNGVRPFTELEDKVANRYPRETFDSDDIAYMPNEVFLYDLGQLSDSNATRKRAFGASIESFLHLPHALNESDHVTPTKMWNSTVQARRDAKKIDICRDEYLPVRRELMELARMSSEWIRTVFLDLPGVYASNRDHLDELLLSWMDDPCGNNKTDTVSQAESDEILNATTT